MDFTVWPARMNVKRNDEHALDFALTYLAFFSLGEFGLSIYG
jgi:hypothetical protein